jgi:hypothetical protein
MLFQTPTREDPSPCCDENEDGRIYLPPAPPSLVSSKLTLAYNATTQGLEYQSCQGTEVFKIGSEKLKSEFDLSLTNQPQFMEEIDRRSVKQVWKGTILNINGVYFIRGLWYIHL